MVIATLLVGTMPLLQSDPYNQINSLISALIEVRKNPNAAIITSERFSAPVSAIILNTLLLTSLCLSLFATLGATLVKQWARQYGLLSGYETLIWKRALKRHELSNSIKRYHLHDIVSWLPMLIHTALLLFFVAVALWLKLVNTVLFVIVTALGAIEITTYLIAALMAAFSLSTPFDWPVPSVVKWLVKLLGVSIRDIDGIELGASDPPKFILSPNPPCTTKPRDQMLPLRCRQVDAELLVDLLRTTEVHLELESVIEQLCTADWGGFDVKSILLPDGAIILQRINELVETCCEGPDITVRPGYELRTRRICRFLEWFYYILTPTERRQLYNKWPDKTIALALAEGAKISLDNKLEAGVADMVLAASVAAKLHHMELSEDVGCENCLVNGSSGPNARSRINIWWNKHITTSQQSFDIVKRGQAYVSACIWSDTDCLLHYAMPQVPERFDWENYLDRQISKLESSIITFHNHVAPHAEYVEISDLLERTRSSMSLDGRTYWFEWLGRFARRDSVLFDGAQQNKVGGPSRTRGEILKLA